MTGPILELEPGLRCAVADNPGPLTLDGSRNYLVGRRRAVLLDPGPADDVQGARIEALVGDAEVAAVALTHAHPDHAGGAARLARRLGARLVASAETLERMAVDGRTLADGDALDLDADGELRAVATPGHTSDHLAFAWPSRGAVFTGDLVLGRGSAMVGHPDGDMGDYLASLGRLLALRPRRLYPGHGEPVDDAVGRLEDYRSHRLEREAQIVGALEGGARDVAGIRERVYGELEPGLARAAEASIRAHLEHLEEGGRELPEISGRAGGDVGHV